ncbi:Flp pilus assembly protein CpaB [Caldanaerobacter subterraneus]|uniref:Flp pilus assembly protein CpaB n=1 Tax=Caldanaerobacter subterraneus TaxID=911092 RepID=A0A7Y2L837_9THEO|nr:Flp pilus assembly protein CpaB [Caldanaerobacter subterraneus]NNG67557.1 Flp pilus assembly protein CpaB [Caldanaerobacter subterraneus]
MKKTRVILLIVFLFIDVFIAFYMIPSYVKASTQTVDVVQFTRDIPANTQITDSMVTYAKVNKINADYFIKDKKDVVGKFAKTNIYKNTFAVAGLLMDTKQNDESYMYLLKPNTFAFGVKTDIAGVTGGVLKPGDVVNVVVFLPAQKNGQDTALSPKILQGIKVLDVRTNNATSVQNQQEAKPGEISTQNNLPSIVVLDVTPEQYVELFKYQNIGSISFAIRSRNTNVQDQYTAEDYATTQNQALQPASQQGNH